MPSPEAEHSNDVEVQEIPTDLDHASDDELWYALSRRYPACVFFYAYDKKTRPECSPGVAWKGGFFAAVGLSITGKQMLDRMVVGEVDDWHETNYPERYIAPTDDDDDDDQ